MSIAVVVPALNSRSTLPATLRTLLAQTRPPDEILVVDNGSQDDTIAVALAFAPRVRVLSCARPGAAAARAAGAAASECERVMFLDADDVVAPDTLQALDTALDEAPDGVAACPWLRFEPHAEGYRVAPASCRERRVGEDALGAWLTGWYHPPCSVLWSRAAYRASGGWDPAIGVNDDGDLAMRALAAGVPLVTTSRGTGYYRRALEPASTLSGARARPDGLASRLLVLDRIAGILAREGRLDDARRTALARAYEIVQDDSGDVPSCAAARAAAIDAARALTRGDLPSRAKEAATRGPQPAPGAIVCEAPDPAAAPELDEPLVSVVIPAFRRVDTLPRAVESVLAQTRCRLEILVVDDASPDDTAEVARRLAARDPRVRLLRQETNGGVAAARNRGIAEARGDLIAFLDADDEWLPEKLARQIAALKQGGPRVGLVYTGVETLGAGGDRIVEPATRSGFLFADMLARNVLHGGGSNTLVPRFVFDVVGTFDETLPAAEDWEMWLRITRFFAVAAVEEPLIRYHDPAGDPAEDSRRRSRQRGPNRAARETILQRYRLEMRRAGVEHLFLIDTARRERAMGDGRGFARQLVRLARSASGRAHLARAALRRIPGAGGRGAAAETPP
ncbi:glycosyltransferase family 2 protein [Salinarimonas ramus]|uniref:Glycosyltransferase 2-like domain-containing protein n=1 Tax=Salinarimonas ramus TaxID=690164 RepID=A0A917Q9U4_9HYPH|nr:glycosyltransferase [Salinarimonas ramus]GGK38275.1 hypothetical protein GCM10011322_26630 [Salinarimonas ramus]